MRAALIAGSVAIAALSIFSLAQPSHSAQPTPVAIRSAATGPTAATTTPAARPWVHHHPKPTSLPPATQMTSPSQAASPTPGSPSLAKMIGQQMMVKFDGTSPDPGLLQRIHDGQVGGVILYGSNITSPGQVAHLDAELQHAALSIFSLASPSHSTQPTPVVIKPTASQPTSSAKTAAAKALVHKHPKPKSLPPATQMTSPSQAATPTPTAGSPSLAKMIGQQLMVKFDGTSPDPGLLQRIRHGQVGGVILYGSNIVSPGQVAQLDAELQHAARSGGNPPLLISTDQEGGQVKRFPWAAPTVPPPDMGAQGSSVAYQQGQATGTALRAAGVNINLAPVADVAHSSSSFIWKQGRSFGMTASTVTPAVASFAQGMEAAGVAPTAKHFPGVGGALTDTDFALEKIDLSAADLAPYHRLIAENIPLIMVGTAVYDNFDPSAPAALSHEIVTGLLRTHLGFQGVTISDDLERPTDQATPGAAAVVADRAGIDIILVSSTASAGVSTYQALLAAAQSGQISRHTTEAAYARIMQLKRQYATP